MTTHEICSNGYECKKYDRDGYPQSAICEGIDAQGGENYGTVFSMEERHRLRETPTCRNDIGKGIDDLKWKEEVMTAIVAVRGDGEVR